MHQDRNRRRSFAGFTCVHCRQSVSVAACGTRHRNHCPYCLWSRHLDERPGDRLSGCKAAMRPAAVEVRADGEWALIHRCTGCGVLRGNRVAGDDRELSLLQLVLRPLAFPAFPLDTLPAR